MESNHKHIDDLLREKFSSFEGEIPLSDWNAIEARLDNRKRLAWFWWAAAGLLLVACVSFFTIYFSSKSKTTIATKTIVVKDKNIQQAEPSTNNKSEKSQIQLESNPVKGAIKKVENTSVNSSNYVNPVKEINNNFTSPELIQTTSNIEFVSLKSIFPVLFLFDNHFDPKMVASLNLQRPEPLKIDDKESKLSFEIGLNLSPALGKDAIRSNKDRLNWINSSYFNSIKGSSSIGNGFNSGLNLQINYGSKWYLRTGMYSTKYTSSKNYNYTINSFPNVTNSGIQGYMPIAPETVSYSGVSTIKFVSVPVLIGNRIVLKNSFGFESKLGLNISKYTQSSGKTVDPTYLLLTNTDGNNSIKKWNTGASVSVGLFYKTKNNLIFTVEPNFSTLTGSAYKKDYPVKTIFYNYGINLNVNYLIKKGGKQ